MSDTPDDLTHQRGCEIWDTYGPGCTCGLSYRRRIADLERQLAEKQAEIDRLMLEFCPEEMTQEQKETWASHQKPATDEARKPK